MMPKRQHTGMGRRSEIGQKTPRPKGAVADGAIVEQVAGTKFRALHFCVNTALNELGFPCHHMFEILENAANKTHLDFWRKFVNTPARNQHNWEEAFANYTAAVDNPACWVWRELVAAYPKGAEAWYESTTETIYFTEKMWQFSLLELFTPFGRKFGGMSRNLIWQLSHRGTMNDRAQAIAHYKQHIEDVKSAVPADRLLVFSVDQGWEPLCRFLDVPVPASEFPNVNDRTSIKKVIGDITKGAHGILALATLIAASLIYGVVLALS